MHVDFLSLELLFHRHRRTHVQLLAPDRRPLDRFLMVTFTNSRFFGRIWVSVKSNFGFFVIIVMNGVRYFYRTVRSQNRLCPPLTLWCENCLYYMVNICYHYTFKAYRGAAVNSLPNTPIPSSPTPLFPASYLPCIRATNRETLWRIWQKMESNHQVALKIRCASCIKKRVYTNLARCIQAGVFQYFQIWQRSKLPLYLLQWHSCCWDL